MINAFDDTLFEIWRKKLLNELELVKKYQKVNELLIKNDWFFVTPLFFQGFELDLLSDLCQKEGKHKDEITKIIYRKFYDLNWTAAFIEGYCKKCSHIEPFLKSIEHSLILAFQRDYEGSIKTLIPIIEGILRRYLNLEQGKEMHKIKFEELRKSFLTMKSELIFSYEKEFSASAEQLGAKVELDSNQKQELHRLQTEYYDILFSFITEFIDKSFYLNTHGQSITNEINRHAILHEFGINISYNLENYLKIYFVLQFLTWIFLKKEGKSIFNDIDGFRYFEKAISYKKIIHISEKLLYEKHLLYKEYHGYDPKLLQEKFVPRIDNLVSRKHMIKYRLFKKLDQLLWRG